MSVWLSRCLPAEVEQRSRGGGDAVSRPAQQVKLRQGSGLLRLDVFQVEATHQEVFAPDVLRHQVHLTDTKRHRGTERAGGTADTREIEQEGQLNDGCPVFSLLLLFDVL